VRLGKAVQQEDRRPIAADLGMHGHIAGAGVHRDVYRAEPVEHCTTVAAPAVRRYTHARALFLGRALSTLPHPV
jgi:hypothetical protein